VAAGLAELARRIGAGPGSRRAFLVLTREFFDQLFAGESSTSEHQHRQAMFGVIAFLVTPGFLIPFQLSSAFELAYLRFPALIEPLTRLIATIFLAYAMVTVGVVAAFVWDALSFDRRDAMVIGPLPVPGGVVVGAKLAAIGALLLIVATAINVITAVPFAMIASSHKAPIGFGRHLAAHLVATTCATTFVFGALVTLRALLGMVRGARVGLESLLQCLLVSALLCFTILTPTSLKVSFARGAARASVHMIPIPTWSPTNWFLGLHEVIRGTNSGEFSRAAWIALLLTAAAVAAAIATTVAGYRRQLRLAVAPNSSGSLRSARLARLIARRLAGRDQIARATADYVVSAIARNRAQQTPVAINAAIGVTLVVIRLTGSRDDFASIAQPSAVVLSIPLMLAFWAAVGLRAAFFVPSELAAAWTFRSNAPAHTPAYRRGVCAALVALVAPAAIVLATIVLAPTHDVTLMSRHAIAVLLLVAALAEVLTLTVNFIPFTCPYRPGHARLRTRWPLYAIGAYGFSNGLPQLELWTWSQPHAFPVFALCVAGVIAGCEVAGRRRATKWSVEAADELEDNGGAMVVLDLGPATYRLTH
jgi:hypothetical protein